jgi:hypothetical protein
MSTKLKMTGTAVYGTVCTVVREDGGREPSSYPIEWKIETPNTIPNKTFKFPTSYRELQSNLIHSPFL